MSSFQLRGVRLAVRDDSDLRIFKGVRHYKKNLARHSRPGPDIDGWWQVDAFRAYAGFMRTDEFAAALSDLLAAATEARVLIMCSESLWWRCHRRLVADALVLLHGVPVKHLAHDNKLTEHVSSAGARVTHARLRYDSAPNEVTGA